MRNLHETIDKIKNSMVFLNDQTFTIPPYTGHPETENVHVTSLEANSVLASYIYSQYHARATEVIPLTTKLDIVRFLRADPYLMGLSGDPNQEQAIPKMSLVRSPGFVHSFGNRKWVQPKKSIGRIYMSAKNAVERTEIFLAILQIAENSNLIFQGKTSWNTSLLRTDDIVFYFPLESHFSEAQRLIKKFLPFRSDDGLVESFFTSYLAPGVSKAVEVPTAKNNGLSFGMEWSTICAQLIIEEFSGKSVTIAEKLSEWGIPQKEAHA